MNGAKRWRRSTSGLTGASPQFCPARFSDVGRRADRGVRRHQLLIGPGFGAVRVGADREVAIEPDRQPGGTPGRRRGRELAVGFPLQKLEELDPVAMSGGEFCDLAASAGCASAPANCATRTRAARGSGARATPRTSQNRAAIAPPSLLKSAKRRPAEAASPPPSSPPPRSSCPKAAPQRLQHRPLAGGERRRNRSARPSAPPSAWRRTTPRRSTAGPLRPRQSRAWPRGRCTR